MPKTPEDVYLISFGLVILMKIVCFILGYKTVKLGYNLISSGIKGEFKFSSNFIGFKADLVSISPGLLFVLLGVMLRMIAVYTKKTVTYSDTASQTPAADSARTFKQGPEVKITDPDTSEIDSIFYQQK